jgi:hypothetical protein
MLYWWKGLTCSTIAEMKEFMASQKHLKNLCSTSKTFGAAGGKNSFLAIFWAVGTENLN